MNAKFPQNKISLHLRDPELQAALAPFSPNIGIVIVDEDDRTSHSPNGFLQTLSLEAKGCVAELPFEQLNHAVHDLHLVILVVYGTNTDAAVSVAKMLKKSEVRVVAVVMQQVASTLRPHCNSVISNLTPGGGAIKHVMRGVVDPVCGSDHANIDYEDLIKILSRTRDCVLSVGSAKTASDATLRAISQLGGAYLRRAEVALVALSAPRATPLKLQDVKTVLNFVKDIRSQQDNATTLHSVATTDEEDEVTVAILLSCVLTVDADVPLTTATN